MNSQERKDLVMAVLGITAFIFGIWINPSDDSATWFADLVLVKSIGIGAFIAAALVSQYRISDHASEKSN